MIKQLSMICLLALGTGVAEAQQVEFVNESHETVPDGAVVILTPHASDFGTQYETGLSVRNAGDADVTVGFGYDIRKMSVGSFLTDCTATDCLSMDNVGTYETKTITLKPNETKALVVHWEAGEETTASSLEAEMSLKVKGVGGGASVAPKVTLRADTSQDPTGIATVDASGEVATKVYTIGGVPVLGAASSAEVRALPPGMYVVREHGRGGSGTVRKVVVK